MRLVIERTALLKGLGHVQSVVERRNTIPILSNVKMEAADGVLRLKATDMDLEVAESLPAQVTGEGATTVPAHTLHEIARRLPEGAQVEFDATGGGEQLALRCGRSRFTLACLPVEDFPVMQGGELPYRFHLAAKDLAAMIDRTRFAISTEETRYYLNGIYLHTAERDTVQVLRAVATDGHRLASVETPLPEGAKGMPGVIVPRKTVTQVRRLIDEIVADTEIALSDTKIRFTIDQAVLTSKLIDGTFPDYERVIPTGNRNQLDVSCKEFSDAVDRVSSISTDRSRAVKLNIANGTLVLSATSPEHGTATEELEVSYEGTPIEIGFNARYLLDIAEQFKDESARLSMADAASPTILRSLSDVGVLYVLMPMRV
jgi:DNA polymerase-3 subunit beta